MASVASEDGDIGFQIAPMVDVVFVLMLFFMASAGSQVVERELSINLPGGGSAQKKTNVSVPIIVNINPDGSVVVNDKMYGNGADKNLQQLRDFFALGIEQFGDKNPVIVRPAPECRHERVMDVLNAAANSGVTKLTFG